MLFYHVICNQKVDRILLMHGIFPVRKIFYIDKWSVVTFNRFPRTANVFVLLKKKKVAQFNIISWHFASTSMSITGEMTLTGIWSVGFSGTQWSGLTLQPTELTPVFALCGAWCQRGIS